MPALKIQLSTITVGSNPTRLKVDSAFHPLGVGKLRTQDCWGQLADLVKMPLSNKQAYTMEGRLLLSALGQERFGNMTRVYYREAVGAFVVFDVTRPATFEAVTKWKQDLDTKLTLPNGQVVPTVLLANKCDQGQELLVNNGFKMDQFCKDNGFVGWFETSAKDNINIEEASRCLVKHIISSDSEPVQPIKPDVINLHLNPSKRNPCSACFRA
uniref:Ras-related protein Rab n=1 Tax=Naja naja TaxID=35670 RepID=A0A8C6XVX7_NAJNA